MRLLNDLHQDIIKIYYFITDKFYDEKNVILIILALAAFLRFSGLGYSDYVPDETTVLQYLKDNGSLYSVEFLLEQRKGPMQFFVAFIPFLFYDNLFNELVFRFLFAVFNVASVYVFYLLVREITYSRNIAIYASLLYLSNGFITAFGRIVQYQSLNLFFSFLAAYLLLVSYRKENPQRYIVSGTVMFFLSLLSHWDAIFIIPVIFPFFWRIFLNKNFSRILKAKIVLYNLLVVAVIGSVFLYPYYSNVIDSGGNIDYLTSRIGVQDLETSLLKKVQDYIFRVRIYNPFLFMPFILIFGLISVLKVKHYFTVYIWFLFSLLVFILFVNKAGTHIYNILIPLFIMAGIAIEHVLEKLFESEKRKYVVYLLIFCFTFLYLQTAYLFVDTKKEYPFEQKGFLLLKTKKYTHEDLTNYKLGFTHNRDWEQIRNFFIENKDPEKTYTYITNEDSSISNFYLDMEYGISENTYAIGVKRPYSFVNDYSIPEIKNKDTVKNIEVGGKTVAKIYIQVDE